MRNWIFIAGLFAVIQTSVAYGQSCDAILNRDLLNSSLVIDKGAAAEAQKAAYCHDSSHDVTNETKISANGQYGIGSGSGSYDQTRTDDQRQRDCGSSSSAQSADAFRYNAQRALNSDAVHEWGVCVRSQINLQCVPQPPVDGSNPLVLILWRPTNRRQANVTVSRISNGMNVDRPNDPHTVYPAGTILATNEHLVEVSRTVRSQPTQVRLEINQDGAGFACSAIVPPIVHAAVVPPAPVDRSNLTERLRRLNFAQGPQCQSLKGQAFAIVSGSISGSRVQNERDRANAAGAIIQFDQIEQAAKSSNCLGH